MTISDKKVPHSGPLDSPIFILGEAPNQDDNELGKIFSGRAGEFLNHCLSLAGLDNETIRFGNVCNYRPEGNNFKFLKGSRQLSEGYEELNYYFRTNKPKIIIPLGNEALRYLGHDGISNWRGSVLPYINKSFIIPTYHPAAALHDGTMAPQMVFDLTKAFKVFNSGYTDPTHDFIIDPSEQEFELILEEIANSKYITADIETVRDTSYIWCMGFAVSSTRAFCIKNHYSLTQGLEEQFVSRINRIIEASNELVFHNGSFDCEQLSINGINAWDKFKYDTMLAQRVIEPELPIGLAYCASVYTDEPYYKNDGKETGKRIPEGGYVYNCKDCIVTYATRVEQEKLFATDDLLDKEKDFVFSRIPLMRELQASGLLIDTDRQASLKLATENKLKLNQKIINLSTGFDLNFRSPDQIKRLLYTELKLPHRKDYKTGKLTTDEDAIVSLIQYVQGEINSKKTEKGKTPWMLKLHALRALLEIRGDEKLISSYLNIQLRPDGRAHSSYYPAGTDTGRWSCGSYVDGSGFNAQTMPRESIDIEESLT